MQEYFSFVSQNPPPSYQGAGGQRGRDSFGIFSPTPPRVPENIFLAFNVGLRCRRVALQRGEGKGQDKKRGMTRIKRERGGGEGTTEERRQHDPLAFSSSSDRV